jgi:adenylate cyclase
MAIEIERRFLVKASDWRHEAGTPRRIRQAYIAVNEAVSVRLRIVDGERAFLTIKSASPGIARAEFEYPIPLADAEELLGFRSGGLIEKWRYCFLIGPARWEIDVFEGALAGLVIAEIELEAVDTHVDLPHWLGKEITDDGRYANASLALYGLPE